MKRAENELEGRQVLSVIEKYNEALDLPDAYDHQTLSRPKGNETIHVLTYEECMEAIRKMRFGDESDLFGREKDDSFAGSIGNYVSLLPRQKQGPVLQRKEKNRGLHAGGTDHHDCGVPGRGEGNDGERGDELYVGEDV